MSRNKNRLQMPVQQPAAPPKPDNPVGYSIPTELVTLPSEGKLYPSDHPLHNKSTVEIRFMTAKDEDVLTSPSYLSNGVAIDKFLENVILDKSIDQESLLVADRNAILIAARITGYGNFFQSNFVCSSCGASNDVQVDLQDFGVKQQDSAALKELGVKVDGGACSFRVDMLEADVKIKISTYGEQKNLTEMNDNKIRLGLEEASTTDFLKSIIVSINGSSDRTLIGHIVDLMPALDARKIRKVHNLVTPEVDTEVDLTCRKCGDVSRMEVPFSTGFFWPEL